VRFPHHRVSCQFSFSDGEGLANKLLSQSYGAEGALGHSSRFANLHRSVGGVSAYGSLQFKNILQIMALCPNAGEPECRVGVRCGRFDLQPCRLKQITPLPSCEHQAIRIPPRRNLPLKSHCFHARSTNSEGGAVGGKLLIALACNREGACAARAGIRGDQNMLPALVAFATVMFVACMRINAS
jgi:hypothetical protein